MKKILAILAIVLFLSACVGEYKANITTGYNKTGGIEFYNPFN